MCWQQQAYRNFHENLPQASQTRMCVCVYVNNMYSSDRKHRTNRDAVKTPQSRKYSTDCIRIYDDDDDDFISGCRPLQ